MLLTANINPGSASSIKEAANKVEEKILETNPQSMRGFRQKNQALLKTPFQAATEVIYTMCKDVTKKKKSLQCFVDFSISIIVGNATSSRSLDSLIPVISTVPLT